MVDTRAIKAWMIKRDITQAELAKKVGISIPTLNSKINDQTGTKLKVAEADRIMTILKIPRDERSQIIFFDSKLAKTQGGSR